MKKVVKQGLNVSNDFINSIIKKNNYLSLKILFYMVFKGEVERGKELSKIKLSIRDLKQELNLDFKNLRQNISKIQKTLITIRNNRDIEDICLIPKAKYLYDKQLLEIDVYNSVLNELYHIKERYTPINLYNIIKLQNKHSIRFLTLLEQIDNYDKHIAKKRSFTKDELNELFNTKYKGIKEIERAIIIPIKDELDELSNLTFIYDLDFDIDETKVGRKPLIGITIYLKENKQRQLKMF